MKIVLASRNKHKIRELKTLLSESFSDLEILSLDDVGLYDDIEEDGNSFAENAEIKARYAAKSGLIAVGDDSGIVADALNGAPGIYSARYAFTVTGKDDHDDEANNRVLLEQLEKFPEDERTGAFVCAICCVLPDGRVIAVEEKACGVIMHEKHGNAGFGYDPLFYYPPLKKSFADLTADEKNAVSHRGKAIRALAQKLKEVL